MEFLRHQINRLSDDQLKSLKQDGRGLINGRSKLKREVSVRTEIQRMIDERTGIGEALSE